MNVLPWSDRVVIGNDAKESKNQRRSELGLTRQAVLYCRLQAAFRTAPNNMDKLRSFTLVWRPTSIAGFNHGSLGLTIAASKANEACENEVCLLS